MPKESDLDLEKAQIMLKLARKNNWGAKYDQTEHFDKKRFQNFDQIIKGLSKINWLIIHHKPNYKALSLNTSFKKELIEFIEQQMPHLKGSLSSYVKNNMKNKEKYKGPTKKEMQTYR